MKKTNKYIILQPIILVLSIACFLSNEKIIANEVTLGTFPAQPHELDSPIVHGTLTNAINSLPSGPGTHVGKHTTRIQVTPTTMPNTEDWRCSFTTGLQWQTLIDDETVEINVTYEAEIECPQWHDRTSTCDSATSEWQSFYNRVRDHEMTHHDTCKEYYSDVSIIIPGYFAGVTFNGESSWLGFGTTDQRKIQAENMVVQTCNNVRQEMVEYTETLYSNDHNSIGTSTPLPSVSAECSENSN